MENAENIDFLIFADAANVWGVDYFKGDDEGSKIRSSIGIGIDWLTPIGPLSFTLAQAITKANNSPYGLSGGVWTDKGSKIFKVTKEIRSGVVWANTFNKFDPASPFGGYKESGTGSEGGIEGLSGYVNLV